MGNVKFKFIGVQTAFILLLTVLFTRYALTVPLRVYFVVIWEVVATSLFFWAVWQHDLICAPPVWSKGWCHPKGAYCEDHFKCFIWETTVGTAYDVTLTVEYVAFWMALIGVLAL